jgi:hypothetical protein
MASLPTVDGVIETEVEMVTKGGFAACDTLRRTRGACRPTLVVVLATAVLLLVAAPASAARSPERDPVPVTATGEGIAPGAPAWVRQHVADVLAGKGGGGSTTASRRLAGAQRTSWVGCKTVWAYRGYNHWLGYTLFRYYQQVSWCSNGFGIYSYVRDRWPETHVGWRFNGHIGSSLSGGSTSRSAWTQGSFAFCVGGCFDHKYPWVLIDVNVNGGWNAYAGG